MSRLRSIPLDARSPVGVRSDLTSWNRPPRSGERTGSIIEDRKLWLLWIGLFDCGRRRGQYPSPFELDRSRRGANGARESTYLALKGNSVEYAVGTEFGEWPTPFLGLFPGFSFQVFVSRCRFQVLVSRFSEQIGWLKLRTFMMAACGLRNRFQKSTSSGSRLDWGATGTRLP